MFNSLRKPALLWLALVLLLNTGCQEASGFLSDPTTTRTTPTTTSLAATTTVPATTTLPPTTVTAAPVTTPKPPPPTRPKFPKKNIPEQAWVPFATVGGITLHHPSNRIEKVGFHESNHDGAREMEAAATAVMPILLESRERGTTRHSAADLVMDPRSQVRSPVTGTVLRGGRYTLYCDYTDNYVVIEPDQHPGWEVKLLHIDTLHVRKGERVTAGQTLIASRPAVLQFESQVDETASVTPAWPHVHIEVVDPTIKDRPSPDGGCD